MGTRSLGGSVRLCGDGLFHGRNRRRRSVESREVGGVCRVEDDAERCPSAEARAFGDKGAAVCFDDPPPDRQAQAQPRTPL